MSGRLSDWVLDQLRRAAADTREIPDDDLVVDCAGTNVDDAYALGFDHGRAQMAAEILDMVEEE